MEFNIEYYEECSKEQEESNDKLINSVDDILSHSYVDFCFSTVLLDGQFTIDELKRIIHVMENLR